MTNKDDRETLQFIQDLKIQVQDLSKNNSWLRNRLNYYRKQNENLTKNSGYQHIQPKVDSNLKRKKEYVSLIQSMHPNAVDIPVDNNAISQTDLPLENPIKESAEVSAAMVLKETLSNQLHIIEDYGHQLAILQSENAVLKERQKQDEELIGKLKEKVKERKNNKKSSQNIEAFQNKDFNELAEKDKCIADLRSQILELEKQNKITKSQSKEIVSSLNEKSGEVELHKNEAEEYLKLLSVQKPFMSLVRKHQVENVEQLSDILNLFSYLRSKNLDKLVFENPKKYIVEQNKEEMDTIRESLIEEKSYSEKLQLELEGLNARYEVLSRKLVSSEREIDLGPHGNKVSNNLIIKLDKLIGLDLSEVVLAICIPQVEPILIDKQSTYEIPISNLRQFFIQAFVKPIELHLYKRRSNKLENTLIT
eukprot:NODE_14_length_51535_cov_1.125049.p9 type:complete len:421 gc:universal NODE_14_length_51535_cov_1.125049:11986-13248(+)